MLRSAVAAWAVLNEEVGRYRFGFQHNQNTPLSLLFIADCLLAQETGKTFTNCSWAYNDDKKRIEPIAVNIHDTVWLKADLRLIGERERSNFRKGYPELERIIQVFQPFGDNEIDRFVRAMPLYQKLKSDLSAYIHPVEAVKTDKRLLTLPGEENVLRPKFRKAVTYKGEAKLYSFATRKPLEP